MIRPAGAFTCGSNHFQDLSHTYQQADLVLPKYQYKARSRTQINSFGQLCLRSFRKNPWSEIGVGVSQGSTMTKRITKADCTWHLGETIRQDLIRELTQIANDRQNKPRTRLSAVQKLIQINAQDISCADDTATTDTTLTIRIEEDGTTTSTTSGTAD